MLPIDLAPGKANLTILNDNETSELAYWYFNATKTFERFNSTVFPGMTEKDVKAEIAAFIIVMCQETERGKK